MSRHWSNHIFFIVHTHISLDLQSNCTVWTSCKCSIMRHRCIALPLRKCNWFILCNILHFILFLPTNNAFTINKLLQTPSLGCHFQRESLFPQSRLKEHCLVWEYLKSRSRHSTHRTDWIVLWKGLSCRIRRWELFSCRNWLAPALAYSTDMPCDWTPSSETPAAQILPVNARG